MSFLFLGRGYISRGGRGRGVSFCKILRGLLIKGGLTDFEFGGGGGGVGGGGKKG